MVGLGPRRAVRRRTGARSGGRRPTASGGVCPGRVPLALACGLAGLAYGAILDFSTWVTFTGEHTLGQYLAISGTALPFNLAHAIGNVVFFLAFGPGADRCGAACRTRFAVVWQRAPGAALPAVLLALVIGAAALAPAGTARAAEDPAAARALSYLEGAATPTAAGARRPARPLTGFTPHGRRTRWRRRACAPTRTRRRRARCSCPAGALAQHRRRRAHDPRPARLRRQPTRRGRSRPRRRAARPPSQGRHVRRLRQLLVLRDPGAEGRGRAARHRARPPAGSRSRPTATAASTSSARRPASNADDSGGAIQALIAAGRRSDQHRAQRADRATCAAPSTATAATRSAPGAPTNAQSTAFASSALVAAEDRSRERHAATAATRSTTSAPCSERTAASATRARAARPPSGSPRRRCCLRPARSLRRTPRSVPPAHSAGGPSAGVPRSEADGGQDPLAPGSRRAAAPPPRRATLRCRAGAVVRRPAAT